MTEAELITELGAIADELVALRAARDVMVRDGQGGSIEVRNIGERISALRQERTALRADLWVKRGMQSLAPKHDGIDVEGRDYNNDGNL